MMSEFFTDLRHAWRTVQRSPGFAVLVVAIMALGIGANTAVFSVVNGVLVKPLPYPGADRLVTLRTVFLATGSTQTLVSIANYRDWRAQSASFEAMSTYRFGESPVASETTAEYGRTASVDEPFFRVLGVNPLLGRTFTPEETAPGTGRVVIISYAYWQRQFGGDPRILDRTIRMGITSRSIVGVMPPGFQFPGDTDVWTPQTSSSTSRTGHNFFAFGRLKPGVTLEQARADLSTVAGRLAQQYPESNTGRSVTAVPLQDELVGDVRLTLYLVWGVVGVVLLIACANTATLLLGKATARTREMAVRAALGAGRARIVRQLTTESLLLALVAGVLGTLLASWGVQALVALSPADVIKRSAIRLDWSVLVFTLGISLATSVFFGLVPALHLSKVDLIDVVKQAGARSVVGGRTVRTRGILVVAEIALAVVLLTGAGLLIKSLMALRQVDSGFQAANVLVVKATGVRSRPENDAFFGQLMARVAALPGVAAAGATSIPPGDFSSAGTGRHYIDRIPETRNRDREPLTVMTIVGPGSFAALGIPFKSGRDFNDGDAGDRPLVAIVNEALVRASLPGQDPVGRTVHCLFDRSDPMTIVGVVGDVRQRNPAMPPLPNATCRTASTRTTTPRSTSSCGRSASQPRSREPCVEWRLKSHPRCRSRSRRWRRRCRRGWKIPISHAVVRDLRRLRGLPRDGGRLWRDGLRRPAAIEGDRPAHGARRQQSVGAQAHSSPGPGPHGCRPGAGPRCRRGGDTSARKGALRGTARGYPGLSGSGSSLDARGAPGGLSASAARGAARSGRGAQAGLNGSGHPSQPATSASRRYTFNPRSCAIRTIRSAPCDAPPTRRTASQCSSSRSAMG